MFFISPFILKKETSMSTIGKQKKIKKAFFDYSFLGFQQEKIQSKTLMLFFQVNHVKAVKWRTIKSEIFTFNATIRMQRIHNKLLHRYTTLQNTATALNQPLPLQDSIFLVKVPTLEAAHKFLDIIKKNNEFLFIGAFFQQKVLQPQEIYYLFQLDNSVYPKLLSQMNPATELHQILQPNWISIIQNPIYNLITCLSHLSQQK